MINLQTAEADDKRRSALGGEEIRAVGWGQSTNPDTFYYSLGLLQGRTSLAVKIC